MVNYGPSRACGTCKRRRKKCNQIRPACTQCSKAGFQCLGYKDESDILFRYHSYDWKTTPVESMHTVATAEPLLDDFAQRNHQHPFQDPLIDAFLHDFTIESKDHFVSRGFLDGLRPLVMASSPCSNLASAMRMITLASSRDAEDDGRVRNDSRIIYSELLRSVRRELAAKVNISSEVLAMIVLLGIYELIVSSEADSGYHGLHVQGVCAILLADNALINLRASTELFQMSNPFLLRGSIQPSRAPGVFCAPTATPSIVALDAILIKVHSVWSRSLVLFANTAASIESLQDLQQHASDLNEKFIIWSRTWPREWLPWQIGSLSEAQAAASFVPTRPGAVDSCFDLYVPAGWNIYRKTHLMILDILIECFRRLHPANAPAPQLDIYLHRAESLAKHICASVPFHLTSNLSRYNQNPRTANPGKPIGALLLLHPLFVLLRSTSVSTIYREYARQCLNWIGQKVKIGQASVLANPANNMPFQFIAEGHILIWAGMLIARPGVHADGGREQDPHSTCSLNSWMAYLVGTAGNGGHNSPFRK